MSTSYGYTPHNSMPPYSPYVNGGIPNTGLPNGGPSTPYASGYHHSANNGPNFSFKKRLERVDWRKIAAVDIDGVTRNLDFNTLQENIMNITFCSIESELDVRTIDPNFVKLFKLAQMTIEYLLHSQDYLSNMVTALEEKLKKAIDEHDETKKAFDKQKSELNEVKKESHKRKKMLAAQQQIIHAGANSYHKCPYCTKAFVNATFLQSHLQRRHLDGANSQFTASVGTTPGQVTPARMQGLNTAVENELKDIRERLRLTESQLQEERSALDSLRRKDQAESIHREETSKQQIDVWKQEQLDQQRREIERVKNMFMKELKEMNEKYSASERALHEMQQSGHRGSNLGVLHDDIE